MMISARQSLVQQAVLLINPDEHRKVECFNAVHVALTEVKSKDESARQDFERYTKRGRRAAARLEAAIQRLQDRLKDRAIPTDLHSIFDKAERRQIDETRRLLEAWKLRCGKTARDKTRAPFRLAGFDKYAAADQAFNLLHRFDREIVATKNSVYCRLAALLCGQSKAANLLYSCRERLSLE